LGIAGKVPSDCTTFSGAVVSFTEPDSYLVTAESRSPIHAVCEYIDEPYSAQLEVSPHPESTQMLVRGRAARGDWHLWRLGLPSNWQGSLQKAAGGVHAMRCSVLKSGRDVDAD
jgi:hypothetical protein